jgi:hypothetical protein
LRLFLFTAEEFDLLFPEGGNCPDIFLSLRNAYSVANEYLVLKTLSLIARIRLASYEHSLKENVRILQDEKVPMFTNYRNAIVLVRGNGESEM